MHTPIRFYLVVPQALFRNGTPTKPKFDYLRTMPPREVGQTWDVKIDVKTNRIDASSGGLSLYDQPTLEGAEDWWVIEAGTPMPLGFHLSMDQNEDGKYDGHFTVRALQDMHIEVWKKTLKEWAEQHAIRLEDYRRKAK